MLLANNLSVGRANKRSRLDKSITSYQDRNSNGGKNEKIDVHKINEENYKLSLLRSCNHSNGQGTNCSSIYCLRALTITERGNFGTNIHRNASAPSRKSSKQVI